MDKVMNMTKAKETLRDIDIGVDPNNLIKEFGRFLSPRLNDELCPSGFVIGCDLALYDLSEGINGSTQEPIRNQLVGYPDMIYTLIRRRVPEIAKVLFPNTFADEVSKICDEV